ncbi:ECF transporter S component [Clostridium estertheticum]|uniref:ECF transporter S component n=1 Tax=Clostridium estertheticum TaxID=238834 RepID=UPI0013EE88B4|nr:ECF transporter S component [Clostridium estertheticum]MBZ9609166.1 ECF transporter S component [Clostridium estertheticum]
MENRISSIKTIDIVQISLMAAITFIAASVIHIPTFMGVLHLGDSMIFLSAILFGRKKAAISSAVGMCLFDLLNGYTMWAPFTLIIKGAMGYIAGTIAYRKNYNGNKFSNNIFAFVVAGIWMITMYYLGGAIILTFISKGFALKQALIISLKDIPTNIFQVVGGIALALPLITALKSKISR